MVLGFMFFWVSMSSASEINLSCEAQGHQIDSEWVLDLDKGTATNKTSEGYVNNWKITKTATE
jgi:hypothetical protein